MSLENERGKYQLTSCENRMSIEDRVLDLRPAEPTTILTNGEHFSHLCRILSGSVPSQVIILPAQGFS